MEVMSLYNYASFTGFVRLMLRVGTKAQKGTKEMSNETPCGYYRGLVTGLICGAAAALLLASRKGGEASDELREEIEDGSRAIIDRAQAFGEGAARDLATAAEAVAIKARHLKERGKRLLAAAHHRADECCKEDGSEELPPAE
jgi:gas vesicle protein